MFLGMWEAISAQGFEFIYHFILKWCSAKIKIWYMYICILSQYFKLYASKFLYTCTMYEYMNNVHFGLQSNKTPQLLSHLQIGHNEVTKTFFCTTMQTKYDISTIRPDLTRSINKAEIGKIGSKYTVKKKNHNSKIFI